MAEDSRGSRKPDGWEKLSREGSATGAEVGFDPKKPANYHVNSDGTITYHGVPDNFHFKDGVLVPTDDAPDSPAAPAAITAASKPPEE
jgi:hypothetical protein